jgi:hypothetical protein
MPQLRSLPAQPVMRDIYRAYPATCKPLGEFTEAAMRGPSPFARGQRELIAAYVSGSTHARIATAHISPSRRGATWRRRSSRSCSPTLRPRR